MDVRIARLESAILKTAEPSPLAPPIAESEPAAGAPEISPAPKPAFETKVGLTILNRVGVITLVLGIAFFFKWAVDNNWVGPAGRVILGVLGGLAAIAIADILWRKGQRVFAQGVTGAGIAILYLSFYAAFGFYKLIPQSLAFALMFAATLMAVALSLRYGSGAIAALGFTGGYLTPLLLSSGEDHPWFLFGYILLLDAGGMDLARRRRWHSLEVLSFSATAILYFAWMMEQFSRGDKKLVATLAVLVLYALYSRASLSRLFLIAQFGAALAMSFIWSNSPAQFFALALAVAIAGLAYAEIRRSQAVAVVTFAAFWLSYWTWTLGGLANAGIESQFLGISLAFLLFFGWNTWRLAIRRSAPTMQGMAILAANGAAFYATAYGLLNPHFHAWLGLLAIAVAAVYFGLAGYLHQERPAAEEDTRPVLLSLGIALCFLTLAIPIQFAGYTITMAWSLEAAALTWIGLQFENTRAIYGALTIFGLVMARLLLIDSMMFPDPKSYVAAGNARFFTFAVSAVALWLAAWWASRQSPKVSLAHYVAGHVVMLAGIGLEIVGWAERNTPPVNLFSVETVGISILFGIYAVILVSAGVITRTGLNRFAGLILIGLVIVKLYLVDIWTLERVYRISAFVILGVLLIGTSFLYSHFRRLIEEWWNNGKGPL